MTTDSKCLKPHHGGSKTNNFWFSIETNEVKRRKTWDLRKEANAKPSEHQREGTRCLPELEITCLKD